MSHQGNASSHLSLEGLPMSPQSAGVSVVLPAGAVRGALLMPRGDVGCCVAHPPACRGQLPLPALSIDALHLLPAGLVPSQQPYSGMGNSSLFILKMKMILCCEKVPEKFSKRQLLVKAVFYPVPFTSIPCLDAWQAVSTVTITCFLHSYLWHWKNTQC